MASAIQVEKIGENRYAPEGANDVNLYAFSGVYDLTLGQLIMAICIRSASVIEEQSVLKMNEVNASASYLEVLAQVGERVMTRNTLDSAFDLSKTNYVPTKVPLQTTYWDFIVTEIGIEEELVPKKVSKMDDKTRVFELISDEMNAVSGDNERQVIDLQSYLSRRDSAYSTSSSTVKKLGQTMSVVANNF